MLLLLVYEALAGGLAAEVLKSRRAHRRERCRQRPGGALGCMRACKLT